MSIRNTLDDLINTIWRNYPEWPTTFSPCSTEYCDEWSRGGYLCIECCLEKIKNLLKGSDDEKDLIVNQLHQSIRNYKESKNNLVSLLHFDKGHN